LSFPDANTALPKPCKWFDSSVLVVEHDLIILDIVLDMVTGDTFLLYLKGMPEHADIPVIVISSYPRREYKSLMDVDPDLLFLDKTVTKDRLIEEIRARIG